MVIAPSYYSLKTSSFVDREEYKQIFKNFLETSEQKEYNVLHYYGISGIGKSKLQQKLQSVLTDDYTDILWANVDFKVKTHREIGTFLFSLRSQLAGKYKVRFDHFDIAHAVYWKKVNPEIDLSKEKYSPIEEGSIVDIMFKILNSFGPFSLLVDIPNYLLHASEKFKKWWIEEGLRFAHKLNEANLSGIEQLLPVFFFTDLQAHLKNESKKAVLFIDTYEALWEEAPKIGNFNSKDEWVRNSIAIFENVPWVICGREKLKWNEVDNEWDNYLDQHEIGILPRENCIEYLESYNIDENDIQSVIIKVSEGYPYYLSLSVDTYLAIKQKGKKPIPEDFPKNHHKIFNRFFHYLDEAERSTLLILSGANFWDRTLFNLLIDEFGTNYPKSEMSFNELHSFSFMKENSDGTWSMHSLMKKSLQENQKPEQKEKVHRYLFNHYDQQLNGIDIRKIEEIHKAAFNEAFYYGKQFMEVENLSSWFSEKSKSFHEAGLWQFLIPNSKDIYEILENSLGTNHPHVATSLNNLAGLYHLMGMYEEALPRYELGNSILEKTLGSEHPDVANSLSNLAAIYYSKGMYEEALQKYKRSLEILEKTLGPEHIDVATTLNNLAELYKTMGNYKEALLLYQRALAIYENALGSDHLNVAISFNNMAVLYELMGTYETALSLHEQALTIRENALGTEHPYVAISLDNLAGLHGSIGNYKEALPLYERALRIRKKTLGDEHPDVATNLNNLGTLYYSMKKYDKALLLNEQALVIREKIFGFEHPDVAASFNNLAAIYCSIGKYEDALPLYKQALEILKKAFGFEHPDIATTLNNLGGLYKSMGKYEEALPLYNQALSIREKALGFYHPSVATSLNNLAGLYESMGKFEQAVPLYERALEIYEKKLGPEHPTYITSMNNLTSLLLKLR